MADLNKSEMKPEQSAGESKSKPVGGLNKMETKPMVPLIISMSVPPLISMFMQYTYNFVDCMFVSWIGEDALTSVSLAFPITSVCLAPNILDYQLKTSEASLKSGSWPVNDYEVTVNEKNREDMPIGKTFSQKVNGNTVKYNTIRTNADIAISPKDKATALAQFKEAKINVKDTYAESEKAYKKDMWSYIFSALVMAGVILVISFIEIFLMIRTSFPSRVKEVGVYRAIGVKKGGYI